MEMAFIGAFYFWMRLLMMHLPPHVKDTSMQLKLAHLEPTALESSLLLMRAKMGVVRKMLTKCGHWRQKVSIVDRYIDVPPSCVAKVAAALYVGRLVKYRINGNGISDQLLAANVVPHILQRFPTSSKGSGLGMTLALLPLLWACIDESMEHNVPVRLQKKRMHNANAAIRQLDQGANHYLSS
jgi:hypothetical protein